MTGRRLGVALTGCLLFAVVGCGVKGGSGSAPQETSTTTATTTTTQPLPLWRVGSRSAIWTHR